VVEHDLHGAQVVIIGRLGRRRGGKARKKAAKEAQRRKRRRGARRVARRKARRRETRREARRRVRRGGAEGMCFVRLDCVRQFVFSHVLFSLGFVVPVFCLPRFLFTVMRLLGLFWPCFVFAWSILALLIFEWV
jgi:hypothetical protein